MPISPNLELVKQAHDALIKGDLLCELVAAQLLEQFLKQEATHTTQHTDLATL